MRSAAAAIFPPPPDTLASFVNWPDAVGDTFTVTVIAGYEDPPLNASERVQVGAEHVQPEPAIPTSVRAAGRISVTVTLPLVGPASEPLLTVSV